ncbi:hypothetical protein BH11PAT1_BH11PAT1_4210 [soil metagenome]
MKKIVQSSLVWDVESVTWYHEWLLYTYSVASLGYLAWLLFFTLNWTAWFALPLIIAEVYRIFFSTVSLLCAREIAYPRYIKPLKDATVDVLIPTYNEPIEIVRLTTENALKIKGVQKVFVLDDGNRPSVKKMAQELGAEYAARTTNEHAKAGNMNNGLKYSTSEYLIMLDADHVPQSNFITRTLGYFIDSNLALVQTPQSFYNMKSIQHMPTPSDPDWNEQTMFYESIQPAKNVFNAAFFVGTSAILRRAAIDSVGGFATGTAAEDIHTSIRIHNKGWKTIFINEKLAYGLAPEDLKEYHKQRVRWGAGSLGLLFRSSDSPLRLKNLTFMQRISYLNSTLAYAQGIFKLFFYILPLTIILSPATAFRVSFFAFMSIYFPYYLFSQWITKVYSRNTYRPLYTEQFNIINIISNFESLKGIVKMQKKFSVSIKIKKKKENSFIFGLLIFMDICMVLGEGYGFFRSSQFMSNSHAYFPPDSLLMALFWNAINIGFLSSVLRHLYRYNSQQQKVRSASATLIKQYSSGEYQTFIGTHIQDAGYAFQT